MGCGCGGSSQFAQGGSQFNYIDPDAATGPNAPGYYWNGPEGASGTAADEVSTVGGPTDLPSVEDEGAAAADDGTPAEDPADAAAEQSTADAAAAQPTEPQKPKRSTARRTGKKSAKSSAKKQK